MQGVPGVLSLGWSGLRPCVAAGIEIFRGHIGLGGWIIRAAGLWGRPVLEGAPWMLLPVILQSYKFEYLHEAFVEAI